MQANNRRAAALALGEALPARCLTALLIMAAGTALVIRDTLGGGE